MEVNDTLKKIAKVKTINMSGIYADEKVNVMLQSGWKIIDKYKDVDEIFPYQYCSILFFVLGHEDFQAQIPLTEREIKEQQEREEQRKRDEERMREWEKEFGDKY